MYFNSILFIPKSSFDSISKGIVYESSIIKSFSGNLIFTMGTKSSIFITLYLTGIPSLLSKSTNSNFNSNEDNTSILWLIFLELFSSFIKLSLLKIRVLLLISLSKIALIFRVEPSKISILFELVLCIMSSKLVYLGGIIIKSNFLISGLFLILILRVSVNTSYLLKGNIGSFE